MHCWISVQANMARQRYVKRSGQNQNPAILEQLKEIIK